MAEPLTGQELLNTLGQLPEDASTSERCRAAGYVTEKKDGTERLNFTGFYRALLEAEGINTGAPVKPGRGRPLSYMTSVLTKGHAVVGERYLQMIGAAPGEQLAINVKRGTVVLTRAGR